jgi:hypothetical protein
MPAHLGPSDGATAPKIPEGAAFVGTVTAGPHTVTIGADWKVRAEKAEARVAELEGRAERAETHVSKLWKDFSRFHASMILAHGAAEWDHPEDGEVMLRHINRAGESLKRTTDSVSPEQSHKTITTIAKDDEDMSAKPAIETITGHKTPGINPGVRVRLKETNAVGATAIVDGWISDKVVRVLWEWNGHRSEVEAAKLVIVGDAASSDAWPECTCGGGNEIGSHLAACAITDHKDHLARRSNDAPSDAALGTDDHAIAGMIEYLVRVIEEEVPPHRLDLSDDAPELSGRFYLESNIREAKKRAKWLRERAEPRVDNPLRTAVRHYLHAVDTMASETAIAAARDRLVALAWPPDSAPEPPARDADYPTSTLVDALRRVKAWQETYADHFPTDFVWSELDSILSDFDLREVKP